MQRPGRNPLTIHLYGYIGGGPNEDRTFVDDFILNVVPAPGAAALLGLGALARRRRAR